jgi:hypothetical protein
MPATVQPTGLADFEQEIRTYARAPLPRYPQACGTLVRYTRHFGSPSGADPKLTQATQRNLFFLFFGYGCNLAPSQTARHAPGIATAQALRRINAQQINADKLEAAMVDHIDQYARFPLPRHWGGGRGGNRRRHAC